MASRSPPASPAPAATATMVDSVPAPRPHTWSPQTAATATSPSAPAPGVQGSPTWRTARGPRGKYVIQTQKHARVSIGTPNVFKQTWVCLLFTQTHLHQQECVYGFIYQDTFGEQISRGSTRAQRSTGTIVCELLCYTGKSPKAKRQSMSQLQVSVYETYVVAVLPMYTQVA